MLRACVINFGKGWVKHLPLAELSYSNSYHASIKAAPYEALYGRKFQSPVCWAEVGEAQLTGPELIQETTEKIRPDQAKDQACSGRIKKKTTANRKRKPIEFEGEVPSSPGNVKIRSNKNTHNFSQTGLRHPLQGLKL
ncbi:putative reverse transcriptase domain-containing protein [Tanacetum coccineum]